MMKVKFTCWWDNDYAIRDRVISNFISEDNYTPEIQLVVDDSYDFLVVFGRSNYRPRTPKSQNIAFMMEPSYAHWVFDTNIHTYCDRVYVHDLMLFGNQPEHYEHASCMPFHFDYQKHKIGDFMNDNNFKKLKKLSLVIRYRPEGGPTDGIYCKQRTQLVEDILKTNLPIDIYGKDWDKSPFCGDPRIKGAVNDKYDAIANYEFTINAENSTEKNYITEKFFDPLLTNTVPVYFGAPNTKEVYGDCYIPYDLNNIDEALGVFEKILNTSNEEYSNGILEGKRRYHNENNVYNEVKKFIMK